MFMCAQNVVANCNQLWASTGMQVSGLVLGKMGALETQLLWLRMPVVNYPPFEVGQ